MAAVRITRGTTGRRGGSGSGRAPPALGLTAFAVGLVSMLLLSDAWAAEAARGGDRRSALLPGVEAHVRATLERELGLSLPPFHAQCMPAPVSRAAAVSGDSLARVVELRVSDAAGAVASLASMGCTDAAMHVARVAVCAQQPNGLFAASVFLPVPPEAVAAVAATARSLRGVRAALAASSLQAGDATFDCAAAASVLVPETGSVSRSALDAAWPSLDEAWPSAGAWAAASGPLPGQAVVVRSRLMALPGIGQAVSWLHFAASSTSGWGGVPASHGAPSSWGAASQARRWVENQGAAAMVSWTKALLSGNRSVALADNPLVAESLIATCHPWESFLPFGPGARNWTELVAGQPCSPAFDAGPEPSWRRSSAGPSAVPAAVRRADLCRLERLRASNWTCLPLAVDLVETGWDAAGGAAAAVAWVDPAVTSLAVLDALGAAASLRLAPSAVPSSEGNIPATAVSLWRAGLRTAGLTGLLLSDPASGGTAFAPVEIRLAEPGLPSRPRLSLAGVGDVSLVVAPHADAGAALPLAAVPPLLRDEFSLADRFNASLVDERPLASGAGALTEPLRAWPAGASQGKAANRAAGSDTHAGAGTGRWSGSAGDDNEFDWPVSAGVGLLTPSLAPGRRPVASLSAESAWFNASAGQLGPVWLRAQALAVAAARAALLPVLAFEASRTASLALAVSNSTQWAAAVAMGGQAQGAAAALPGCGLDVTAEGLWAAAQITVPRGEAALLGRLHKAARARAIVGDGHDGRCAGRRARPCCLSAGSSCCLVAAAPAASSLPPPLSIRFRERCGPQFRQCCPGGRRT